MGGGRTTQRIDTHPGRPRRVTAEWRLDRTRGDARGAVHEGQILARNSAPLDCRPQSALGIRGERDDEEPGGVPVEAVHDPPAAPAANSPDLRPPMQHPGVKCHSGGTRPGAGHAAGRLVDHAQVGAPVDHVEGKGAGDAT